MKKKSYFYDEIPMSFKDQEMGGGRGSGRSPMPPRGSKRRKRRRMRRGSGMIIFLLVLMLSLIGVLYYMWSHGLVFDTLPGKHSSTEPGNGTPTAEPTITLGELQAWENPTLKNSRFTQMFPAKTVESQFMPGVQGMASDVFSGKNILTAFVRDYKLSFGDPVKYQQIPGVLTFRGNNFRNSPSYGYVSIKENKVEQIWERQVGSLKSSRWDFYWSGTGWTGQPVIVQWPEETRKMMNIYESKKSKAGLVEVIYATMDGKIYFFDIDDGKSTRDPIDIKAPIKGSPAVDPRGYPILYVGQGDNAPPSKNMPDIGMRIFSLIDQSLLSFIDGMDPMAFRTDWGACDSSPIIDGPSDTLVWASENGIIYTAKLNAVFDKAAAKVTINPIFTNVRYKSTGTTLSGIESSPSVYGHYVYFSDNSGILSCFDLNTLKPVWSRPMDDDTDVTPVLSQESDGIYLYTGTEVDYQQRITGTYLGQGYVYKIDAMTGRTMWRNSYPCWTQNDEANVGNDINGGVMGTPVVGKNGISNLVVYSFCMTNGIYSGNVMAAYDKVSGQVVWTYKSTFYSWSSPIDVYDETGRAYILLPDYGGNLIVLDGLTGIELTVGKIMMRDETGGNVESSAAVFGDILVVGTRRGVIVGMKLK